jgi:hypothetical protein
MGHSLSDKKRTLSLLLSLSLRVSGRTKESQNASSGSSFQSKM